MRLKLLNNRKFKRPGFNNKGLWIAKGIMFPCDHTYYQVGIFGYILIIHFDNICSY